MDCATDLDKPMRVDRTRMMHGSPTEHRRSAAPWTSPSDRSTSRECGSTTWRRTAVVPGSRSVSDTVPARGGLPSSVDVREGMSTMIVSSFETCLKMWAIGGPTRGKNASSEL